MRTHRVPARPNRRVVMGLVLPTVLLLAACGGDADGSDADGSTTPAEETTDAATDRDEDVATSTRLWVRPDRVECEGVGPQECLEVATAQDGPYELFYDEIVGYEHVDGTGAVLDVTVEEVEDPPADGSSERYTLVEVVEQDTDGEA